MHWNAKTILAAGGGVAVLLLVVWAWRRPYPPMSSQAYQYANALYSICNRHDEERLEKIATMLAERAADGELTKTETQFMYRIIRTARSGRWEKAVREVRRWMVDQAHEVAVPALR
ncbi:MAG: hypothetical protein KatS3mg111_3047 [Pirellulaceae bacterium]|nr:MAG: hypothetical protein KatS3mg111_3047 [Pirellulaceae bacterium]